MIGSVVETISIEFVEKLDDNSFELFFNAMDFTIESTKEMLQADSSTLDLKRLSEGELMSLEQQFLSLIEVYAYYEYFEECEDIRYILSRLEKYRE